MRDFKTEEDGGLICRPSDVISLSLPRSNDNSPSPFLQRNTKDKITLPSSSLLPPNKRTRGIR